MKRNREALLQSEATKRMERDMKKKLKGFAWCEIDNGKGWRPTP